MKNRFLHGSEKLVDPMTVGAVHFFQPLFAMLPLSLQRRMLEGASSKTPYMGFVVEPYAMFLFYRIADHERAQALLPDGFKLARSRVFEDGSEEHYAIVSLFRVHASTFWGSRAELYLIAENQETGLLSWVIADYLSDTVSYDRANGLRGPSAPGAVITTSADGRVVVDLSDTRGERAVAFDAKLANAALRPLDARLWVEGNLSVAYGPKLSPDHAGTFALTFTPDEMTEALDIPLDDLRLERMTWHDDMLEDAPTCVACFPFAQHLLSDSPGSGSGYASTDELEKAVASVDFDSIPKFSTPPVRKGLVVSTVMTAALVGVLAIALATRAR
ncbi:MAG: hypothetical protein IJ087_18225 [Eggerthellaceae bacterium]|nr:hypothetical protein [Eggerthellaceae bacterium]